MSRPKYSVLIPTRERAVTLAASLRTLTSQDYESLEIVVSDNCSSDGTREVVEATADARVKYVRTDRRVSMSHNWEHGLSHCSGDWISIIGDDDGFLPNCFPRIDAIIEETSTEAVVSRACYFVWPSPQAPRGLLTVPVGDKWVWVESARKRAAIIQGRAHYGDLPLLYNGTVVSRRAIDEARGRNGMFFQSCIPDVYSGIALSCVLDRYVFSGSPVSINGSSKFSTGTSQMRSTKSSSEDEPAKLFEQEGNLPFHPSVPLLADGRYPPSIPALVLECYLQAQQRFHTLPPPDLNLHAALILDGAGSHRNELQVWSREFHKVNRLTEPRDQGSIFPRIALARACRLWRRAYSAFSICRVDLNSDGAQDVYEATLLAERVRRASLSAVDVLRGRVAAKLQRTV